MQDMVEMHVPQIESNPRKENVQNYNEKGHYARDCQKPRVRDAKYFRKQMLLAMKDEARSNLKDEENDFMLDNSYGDKTLKELTTAVIMIARIQPANDNAMTEPTYDAKVVSELFDLESSVGVVFMVFYGLGKGLEGLGLHKEKVNMVSLADKAILSGAENRPPMLEKDMYDSWRSRMEMYMLNRQHRRIILESVEHGPLLWPSVTEEGVTRLKKYSELSAAEAIQADCDVKATNIIL
nr:hypothetical protein [Tanacetum cinerariifolium]